MAHIITIKSGPSKGDVLLSLLAQPQNKILVEFRLDKPECLWPGNTPDDRLEIELLNRPSFKVLIYALEMNSKVHEGWSFKAIDEHYEGVRFVGQFSTKTRKGHLTLEPKE